MAAHKPGRRAALAAFSAFALALGLWVVLVGAQASARSAGPAQGRLLRTAATEVPLAARKPPATAPPATAPPATAPPATAPPATAPPATAPPATAPPATAPPATTPPVTAPKPKPTPAPASSELAVASVPSGYGCAAALAYLASHQAPGFVDECPGYALGHQAMTCINVAGVCAGEHLIAIADPCPAAYENEASNSWVLSGLRSGPIDPYGYCH